MDGLYRVSGNLAVIQKLRFAVNHGRSPAFPWQRGHGGHGVTGHLCRKKMSFLEREYECLIQWRLVTLCPPWGGDVLPPITLEVGGATLTIAVTR